MAYVTYRLNEQSGQWHPVYAGPRLEAAKDLRDETNDKGIAAPAYIYACSDEDAHQLFGIGPLHHQVFLSLCRKQAA